MRTRIATKISNHMADELTPLSYFSHCKSGSALRVFLFQHKMLFESIPHFKKKEKGKEVDGQKKHKKRMQQTFIRNRKDIT